MSGRPAPTVKCVVWDLDHTVWDGVLLEGGGTTLRAGVREALVELDRRGILHSIASRNEPGPALDRLAELGLAEFFLHPQIGWGAKSGAVARIAAALNLGIDSLALVDDQQFERDEVAYAHTSVRCLDAAEVTTLVERPEFRPPFVTDESARRRSMYVSSMARQQAEEEFAGTEAEFLAQLDMVFTVTPARTEHLRRAEELTIRTHQLNSTGRTFSYDRLAELTASPHHLVTVAELVDRYGSYGTIGLAVVEKGATAWRLLLLLMSCRVMSRGVGTVLLNEIQRQAHAAGVRLAADFVPTDRNRIMYVTYRFAGFTEVGTRNGMLELEWAGRTPPDVPGHLRLVMNE